MKEQPGTCQSHPHLLALTSYIREPRRCPQQLTCAHLCTRPTKGPAVPTLFSSRLSWSFVLFPRILDMNSLQAQHVTQPSSSLGERSPLSRHLPLCLPLQAAQCPSCEFSSCLRITKVTPVSPTRGTAPSFLPSFPRLHNPRETQGMASPCSTGRCLQPQRVGQNSTFGNAASTYIQKNVFLYSLAYCSLTLGDGFS